MMESKLAFLFWKIQVLFYSGSSDQAHTSVLSPTNNSCRQSFQSHYNAHTPKRTAIRVGSLSTQHNTCFYRLDVIPAVLNRPDNKKPNESQLHEEYLCLTWIKMLDTSRFSMNNVSQNISNCSSTRFPPKPTGARVRKTHAGLFWPGNLGGGSTATNPLWIWFGLELTWKERGLKVCHQSPTERTAAAAQDGPEVNPGVWHLHHTSVWV